MQPSASTPGEAPQPRQSEGKTPVPSRAQQSSARLRGARQHPSPSPAAQRACAAAHSQTAAPPTEEGAGGVCSGSVIVRLKDGERLRSGLSWRAWREKGGGEKGKAGSGDWRKEGRGRMGAQIPEAGEGRAGWVPQELARGKDNAQESRDC